MSRLLLALALALAGLAASCRKVVEYNLAGQFHLVVAFPEGDLEEQTTRFGVTVFARPLDCALLPSEGGQATDFAWPAVQTPTLPLVPVGATPTFVVEARRLDGTVVARGCSVSGTAVAEGVSVTVTLALRGAGPCAATPWCALETGVCADVKEAVVGRQGGRLGTGEGHARGSCASNPLGAEDFYRFTAPEAGRWIFSTHESPAKPRLVLRRTCDERGSELGCDDEHGGSIGVQLAAGESVYAIVGVDADQTFPPYTLDILRDTACDAPETLALGARTVALSGVSRLEASCARALSDHVFRFTAPSDGVYSFALPDDDGWAAVSLRRTCADPASELFCQQVVNTPIDSLRPTVFLRAEETIFVIVEGKADVRLVVTRTGVATSPAPMIRIPAGPFLRGSPAGVGGDTEHPQQALTLSAFDIDAHEVTLADYLACVGTGACRAPGGRRDDPGPPDQQGPATDMDWFAAREYCIRVGKRLPTAAEWEKAARGGCELRGTPACEPGVDDVLYPWGNDAPDCTKASVEWCAPMVERVGTHRAGDSIYGVEDLAGNAVEFTSDCSRFPYAGVAATDPRTDGFCDGREIRGGSSSSVADEARVAARAEGRFANRVQGFRCAR